MKVNTTPATRMPANLVPGGAYETNLHLVLAGQCREEYAALYTLLQTISQADIEGIVHVTLRTRTRTIEVPLTGELGESVSDQLAACINDMLGVRLDKLERSIVKHEQDSLEEKESNEEGENIDPRAETFAFCLPMRPLSDAEFEALPAEARRAYDERRAEQVKAA